MTEVNKILKNTSAYQIAESLDKQDGSADGKISASIWNAFVEGKGGKKINTSISLENAMKSITSYAVRNAKSEKTTANDLGAKWLNSPSAEKSENIVSQESAKDVAPAEKSENAVPAEKSENSAAKRESNEAAPVEKSVNPDTSKGDKEVAQESQKTEVPESSVTENTSKKNPVRGNSGAKKTPAPVARARNSKPRKNPVRSNAGTSKAAVAKQQGLRATYNPNYYYSETEKEHYRWNPKTQKFVKYSNIAYFNKDQSYVRKYKNKDGSSKVVDYSKDGYPTKMQARNSKNQVYQNKDFAVKKLGLRETYATKSQNVYYDEATKTHYRWNDKTHSFDLYGSHKTTFVEQEGGDYEGKANIKVIKYSNGVNKKEIIKRANNTCENTYNTQGNLTRSTIRDTKNRVFYDVIRTYTNGKLSQATVTWYKDGKKSSVKKYDSHGYTNEEYYEKGVITDAYEYKRDANNKEIGGTHTEYRNGKAKMIEEYVYDSDGSKRVTKLTEIAN